MSYVQNVQFTMYKGQYIDFTFEFSKSNLVSATFYDDNDAPILSEKAPVDNRYFIFPNVTRGEIVFDQQPIGFTGTFVPYYPVDDVWFMKDHFELQLSSDNNYPLLLNWLTSYEGQQVTFLPWQHAGMSKKYKSYISSNPEVLTVSEEGRLILLKSGTTTMTWTFWRPFYMPFVRTIEVTVIGPYKMKSTPFPLNFRKMKLIE